jgi:TIR domain-containing protein
VFDPRKLEREMRTAQRKAEAEVKREIDRVNRENKRRVEAHNRKVEQHNRKVVTDHNREVDRLNRENQRRVEAHNRRAATQNRKTVETHSRQVDAANRHNRQVIADLNQRLRTTGSGSSYTTEELALADRIQSAVAKAEEREWDTFLSYARIDGADAASELREQLENLDVSVWFDEIAITPGKSQSLQMDKGLQKARAGIALLTPAYLTGRFWTERELGALLHKETLIPVLHGVTFEDVAQYSGILPDLAGFETARDSIDLIAEKIAAAVAGNSH